MIFYGSLFLPAQLPNNGIDEFILLSDWAFEWGLVLASIIGLAFAFSLAYLALGRILDMQTHEDRDDSEMYLTQDESDVFNREQNEQRDRDNYRRYTEGF